MRVSAEDYSRGFDTGLIAKTYGGKICEKNGLEFGRAQDLWMN